jgi:hypothetical protein
MDIPFDSEVETDEEAVERAVRLDHEYITEYGPKGGWYLGSRLKRTNARKASILLGTCFVSGQPGSSGAICRISKCLMHRITDAG